MIYRLTFRSPQATREGKGEQERAYETVTVLDRNNKTKIEKKKDTKGF